MNQYAKTFSVKLSSKHKKNQNNRDKNPNNVQLINTIFNNTTNIPTLSVCCLYE